jgi:hypothetical protein
MDRSRPLLPRRLTRRALVAAGLLALGFGVVLGALALGAGPARAATARPVVVELYTSQGCSSCPPADQFLARLAARKDVLALSLPVTYWDMLGWKDTLASKANTDRQKAYARAMGRGGVYTPQMIVDGVGDVVGSRVAAIDKDIAKREADQPALPVHLKIGANLVALSVAGANPHIRVAHSKMGGQGTATIWLFVIRPSATVKIGAGENDGRTVTYRNVVEAVKAVGVWTGKPVSLNLPRSALGQAGDGIAVVVQQNGYGRIIGATSIGWLSNSAQ